MDTPSPYSRSSDLSSNDISKVQEEINVYEVAVSSVDAEIQELAKQAAILRHKKHRLLELIAQCRGRITLALRVPDEILAHCFEHCVSGGWYKAPLILSHVCRKWRQAAMTPSVFSRVHLANESRDPVAKTKLWLSRALNTPLNITVDVYAVDSQILSAFDLLVDRADQWTNLDLYTSHISQANDLFSLCIRPIPNLVSLRVYCVDLQNVIQLEADRLAMIGPASINAPKLRTYEVLTNTFTIQYPTQVSHISLELDSSITALPPLPPDAATTPFILLSDLPSLTSLTITTAFDYRETFNDTTPIIPLPHLEQLTLNSNRASIQILEYIDAPKLRSLRIRSVESPLSHPYAPTGSALRRFLVRSSPPLTTLELHDVDLPVSDYLECFSLLRSLESLRLHETEIPDEAFSALHGPDAYLPNLVSLDLRWCEQLAGSALVDLVASRRQPPRKPIAFVRVINCAVVKELDVLALARMTTCSIVVKEMDDYCRSKGCCNNARYRQRMRLRHLTELSDKEERLDLVLD